MDRCSRIGREEVVIKMRRDRRCNRIKSVDTESVESIDQTINIMVQKGTEDRRMDNKGRGEMRR